MFLQLQRILKARGEYKADFSRLYRNELKDYHDPQQDPP